jgi:hypothetical protein
MNWIHKHPESLWARRRSVLVVVGLAVLAGIRVHGDSGYDGNPDENPDDGVE